MSAAYVDPPLALGVQSLPDPFDEERLGANSPAMTLLEAALAEGDILGLWVHAVDLELPVAPAFPINGSGILNFHSSYPREPLFPWPRKESMRFGDPNASIAAGCSVHDSSLGQGAAGPMPE